MSYHRLLVFLLAFSFITTGCLENLGSENDSDSFWGDDCTVVSDEICKSGPAPGFVLVDQNNKSVNMSEFEGKIVVITFLYTHCPDICPAITYQMNKLSEELGDEFGESVVFLTMTVDPDRDTPERLSEFAGMYNASWPFLTSTSDSPVGNMSSIWQDYGIYVNIDDEACSGHGHYMDLDGNLDTPDECHCDPGYMQDEYNIDECIADLESQSEKANLTFEQGGIESQIIQALDLLSNGLVTEAQSMIAIDALISQMFAHSWSLYDTNETLYNSSTYYTNSSHEDFRNLTLLEFFHTDCSHCQNQIPVLKEFYSNYSSNVSLLSIGGYNLGADNTDTLEDIKNFTIEYNSTWPYLYDNSSQLMNSFGQNYYPSWVLIEDEKIIGISKGSKSYSDLVDFVGNSAISKPMEEILFNLEHWAMFHDTGERHISDKDMIEIIAAALNYNYTVEDSKNEDYGVTHSSKLYIIDQEGNMRVVWRGFDWTYASVYHDIELLL